MSFLTEWVTQIILFLLLAMIIELLLPNSSMKKYINMVVGLLLILIFLQPLFQLFQVDVEDVLSQAVPALDTGIEQENMKNSIELKKNEIQASQDAYVLEEMAVQMKKQVEEELNNEYGVGITDISFQFANENEIDVEALEIVNVLLDQKDVKEQKEQKEDGIASVNVEEIDIGEQVEDDEPTPETEDIKAYLAETWQLDKEIVTILWEGGV